MTTKKDEKGTKVEAAFRAERQPAVVLDTEAEKEAAAPPVDTSKCQCTGVERRWDTDGLVEPGKYRCSVCGKWYS